MSDNRTREWWVTCHNCGHEHRIANYGRRVAVDRCTGEVKTHTTVHEAGCFGWRLMGSRERSLWEVRGRPVQWYKVPRA